MSRYISRFLRSSSWISALVASQILETTTHVPSGGEKKKKKKKDGPTGFDEAETDKETYH